MSHESVVASLKALIKHDLFHITPDEFGHHVAAESDRSLIILTAAMVERFVLESLVGRMPSINSDERNRIFNFEGPCGSFSNRIRLAQAIGVFDRPTRRQIEVVKEMRNVAAHCVSRISFDTPEVLDALTLLLPNKYHDEIRAFNREGMRYLFDRACGRLNMVIVKPEDSITYDQVMEMTRESLVLARTSRNKSPGS